MSGLASSDRKRIGIIPEDLFAGPGEIRELCRAVDWTATPLGPVAGWPEELKTAIRLCLDSVFPMAVWCGADFILIYNCRYPEVLGSRHPGALGRPAREVWAEVWDQLRPEFEQVLAGSASTWHEDARFVLQRGAEMVESFFTYSLSPIRDETGTVAGIFNVLTETTERVRALAAERDARERLERAYAEAESTRALRDAHQRFVDAVESLEDGFLALDHAWRFIYANRRAAAALGIPAGELIGREIWELFPDLAGTPQEEAYRQVMSERKPTSVEVAGRVAPGWFRVDISPTADGIAIVWADITAPKRTEEALKESNRRLREADQRKNEFLALLSHELRNPLAPITNAVYLLDHAVPGGDEARRAQAIIDRQARQLARLVDDLLDVTRITRNKIHLQRERLELNELVGRTIEDHRSLFEDRRVRLDFEPFSAPVFVNGDWNRLAQVIGNLLQNATKFTPPGGSTIVSVGSETGGNGVPRGIVRVIDTGVGLTGETLACLFQPFMQAEVTLDRSKGGLGLGLALVKGLVELHGGEVTAHSAGLNQGTEFIVSLPIDTTEPSPEEPSAPAGPKRHRRVLVIDDNFDAADSLRLVLEFSGHVVDVADNGPEGIARARKFHPEVVLCDIGLPGLDGYGVAREFRADPVLKDTYLVALSGYALPEAIQRSHEAGFNRHMSKPPDLEQLEELLQDGA